MMNNVTQYEINLQIAYNTFRRRVTDLHETPVFKVLLQS